jgi:hypothetical protein
VTIDEGVVTVQRNGFVADADRLDALVEAALTVAAAARAAGLSRCAPQPLDVALPAPPTLDLRGILADPGQRRDGWPGSPSAARRRARCAARPSSRRALARARRPAGRRSTTAPSSPRCAAASPCAGGASRPSRGWSRAR